MTFLLIMIYISFISLGLPDSLLGSAWPSMQPDLGVSISYAGIISFIVAGGTIASSLFSSFFIKRYSTGLITAISVSMTALSLVGFGIVPSFLLLCVLALPLGLGAGCVDAVLNSFVALHFKAKHMNWLHCFWGVGATAGPIIMSFWLSRDSGWKLGYLTIGLLQAILVLALFLSLPHWKKAVAFSDEHVTRSDTNLKFRDLFHIRGAKVVLIAFFCYCSLEATTGLWGSSFLVLNKGLSTKAAAGIISLFYLGITLGRLISGFISMKLNNLQMIRMGLFIILIGIVLLLLPFDLILMPAGFFFIGLGCAPIYPGMLHQTPKHFGSHLSQSMMGIQMACAYVGTTLIPPFFGLVADYITISIFPCFLAALFVGLIFTTEKSRKLGQPGA